MQIINSLFGAISSGIALLEVKSKIIMSKKTVHFTGNNIENISQIAKQERQTFNKMLNLIISDATSGELIRKSSISDFIKANPKVTGKQILEYFKL